MPNSWIKFLNTHNSNNFSIKEISKGAYGIYRNTKTEWQNWRYEIKNETFLNVIEQYCNSSLLSLNYNFYGSLENLKDLDNYPSLIKRCSNLPC